MIASRLRTYASFVRVSHSVFALPFALAGALLAARSTVVTWGTIGWILVAMVTARSAAMGFNRLVDARTDALNPRTANREIPRGAMSMPEATVFVIVSSTAFVFASWRLNVSYR
jgi:4-hydroxybenzoate polyprenyltransferase